MFKDLNWSELNPCWSVQYCSGCFFSDEPLNVAGRSHALDVFRCQGQEGARRASDSVGHYSENTQSEKDIAEQ